MNFLDRQLLSILAKPIQDDLGVTDGQLGLDQRAVFRAVLLRAGDSGRLARRSHQSRAGAVARLRAVERGDGRLRHVVQLSAAGGGADVGGRGRGGRRAAFLRHHLRLLSARHARHGARHLQPRAAASGRRSGVAFGASIAAAYSWRSAFVSLGAGGRRYARWSCGRSCASRRAAALDARRLHARRCERRERRHAARAKAPFWPTCRMFFSIRCCCACRSPCGATQFVTYAVAQLHDALPDAREGHDAERGRGLLRAAHRHFRLRAGCTPPAASSIASRRARRRHTPTCPRAALALAIPFFVGFVWAPHWPLALVFLAVPTCSSTTSICRPPSRWCRRKCGRNERVLAGALLLLVMNLIGLGLGPTFLGAMSDFFRADASGAFAATGFLHSGAVLCSGRAVLSVAGARAEATRREAEASS